MRLTDRRLFAALLLLCVVVISRGSPAMTGDAAYYLAIGDSILRDGDLNLRNQYDRQGEFLFRNELETSFARNGKRSALYPSQGVGFGAAIAPVSWVAQAIAGALPDGLLARVNWTRDRAARDLISLAMAVLAAWLLVLSVRLTERVAGQGAGRWPLLLAFAAPPLVFMAIHPAPEILAALAGVWFALEMTSEKPRPLRAALALALLPWLHGRFVLVAIAGAIWLARRLGWRAAAPAFASVALLVVSATLMFGTLLPPKIQFAQPFSIGRWMLAWPDGLFSLDHGLFWIAPFWLLAIGGLGRVRSAAPEFARFALWAAATLLVMGEAFDDGRPSQIAGLIIAPALPLLAPALVAAVAVATSRWRVGLRYALVAWTIAYAVMVVARPRRLLAAPGEGLGRLPVQSIQSWQQRNSPERQLARMGLKPDEDALIQSAISGDVAITRLHLDAGIGGGRALIAAASAGRAETVSLILARLGTTTHVTARALAQARALNHTAAVAALQSAGVTLDTADPSGDTALMVAIREHREDEWDLLVKLGANVNLRTRTGETALMFAVAAGDYPAELVLIGAGADVNAADVDGWTALMRAARFGRVSHASGLVRARANVNATSRLGWTPLMWAAYGGHDVIVTMLLEAGANPNARSVAGQTALARATSEGHERTVKLLLAHGAEDR